MAANNESAERRVVPRWRTFRQAVTKNELSAASVAKAKPIPGAPFLEEKEAQWLGNKHLPFAIDLISAATVLGKSRISESAAEFVLENGSLASVPAQQLAKDLLGIAPPKDEKFEYITRLQIIEGVKYLKARRLSQTGNAFVWSDLARLYVLLGQTNSARHAMRVALGLAPTERFIVRSATRFFLHSKDPEQALYLLRSNPRTPFDPWLSAAEIAVSSVLEKTPKFARRGHELLKSADLPPFHTSELATALGSLEMFGGNNRKANKLFLASLKEPTENALAQVVWASKRTGLGEVSAGLLQVAQASEAKTFDAYNHGQWSDVVCHANIWAQDEGFSARPRALASAVATSLLDDPQQGEIIADLGLATNPGHPGLINNIAFALIERGKAQEGLRIIDHVDKDQITPVDVICLLATAGLAYFRLGNSAEGTNYYQMAIDGAVRQQNDVLKILARLYLAREKVFIGDREALKEFRIVYDEAKKHQNTYLPDIAAHLAKKVIDIEVRLKGLERGDVLIQTK